MFDSWDLFLTFTDFLTIGTVMTGVEAFCQTAVKLLIQSPWDRVCESSCSHMETKIHQYSKCSLGVCAWIFLRTIQNIYIRLSSWGKFYCCCCFYCYYFFFHQNIFWCLMSQWTNDLNVYHFKNYWHCSDTKLFYFPVNNLLLLFVVVYVLSVETLSF